MKAAEATKATDGNEQIETAAKVWLTKVSSPKKLLEQMPDKRIPELQHLTDRDWLRIAENAKLDTDANVSETMSDLRDASKQHFTRAVRVAL